MKSSTFGLTALILVLSSLSPCSLASQDEYTSYGVLLNQTNNETPVPVFNEYYKPIDSFLYLDWHYIFALQDVEILSFEIPEVVAGKGFKAKKIPDRRGRKARLLEESTLDFDPDDLIVSVTFRDICKLMHDEIFFYVFRWPPTLFFSIPRQGFLLGPPLADFVPYPGALVLTGNLGLIGLILESGISLDVDQLKENAWRALLLAIVGSTLPLLSGFGIGRWIGLNVKPAIAVGAAFAPSSLGVASNALSSGDVLNTPIGQTIVASSVFDDVLGLILLSILEVFADPDPPVFDYILPFISSFGYLIVLGSLGISVFPGLIRNKILPLVSEGNRERLASALATFLVVAYMLALNYSRASFLTGVFLAGLTFSQLQSVRSSFVKHGRPLLDWMWLFSSGASVSVSIATAVLPVLAKVPLGMLVPHFQRELPLEFPYNPHVRDMVITSLAMTCRGEFNVIVASYALSEGLFGPDIYSSVIFAILFGSIVSPLILSKVLKHYNHLSSQYLEAEHSIERIGNTNDGYRPLYLVIQARTPVRFNLQEEFKRTLEEDGLIIIDHRSWHTLAARDVGKDAVNITELFVQDTKVKVRISGCFGVAPSSKTSDTGFTEEDSSEKNDFVYIPSVIDSSTSRSTVEEGLKEDEKITTRCDEIKEALTNCLKGTDPDTYRIQVSQWQTFVVDNNSPEDSTQSSRKRFYTFNSFADVEESEGDEKDEFEINTRNDIVGDIPIPKPKGHKRTVSFPDVPVPDYLAESPSLASADLWENDNFSQEATRFGYVMSPDIHGYGGHNMTEGLGDDHDTNVESSAGNRERANSLDPSALTSQRPPAKEREVAVIKDRLKGYVRRKSFRMPIDPREFEDP
eukprot:scaffold319_cov97-Cylindrotheca_fusiformis.AAC.3